MAKRTVGILYVPERFVRSHYLEYSLREVTIKSFPDRNQHVIKSSIPTSYMYRSPANLKAPNFVDQFECKLSFPSSYFPHDLKNKQGMEPSTLRPISPFPKVGRVVSLVLISLLTTLVLRFRKWLGGESKINEYCHDLALKGGKRLAEVLGTRVLDPIGEFTLNMVCRLILCVEALILYLYRSMSNYHSRWNSHLKSTSCSNASSSSIVRFMQHTTGIMVIGGRGVVLRSGMRRVITNET